jgi:hypothetical protein
MYFINEVDSVKSLQYFEFSTRIVSEGQMTFEGQVHDMIVDPCSTFCYVTISNNSPAVIQKIDLMTYQVVKTVDTAEACKLEGDYEMKGGVDMVYIEKGNPSHKIFVK